VAIPIKKEKYTYSGYLNWSETSKPDLNLNMMKESSALLMALLVYIKVTLQ
jgi:hypothetical protein